MAMFYEPTPEQKSAWKTWVAERPLTVRAVAERFDPWSLYRMKPNGERVTIASFGEGENGVVTVTVNVTAEYNFVLFERQVFGVPRAVINRLTERLVDATHTIWCL